MRITHDPDADAVYVYLTEQPDTPVAHTRELDDARMLDYATDGTLLGVELLWVSEGVDLTDVPFAARIASELRRHGIQITEAVR